MRALPCAAAMAAVAASIPFAVSRAPAEAGSTKAPVAHFAPTGTTHAVETAIATELGKAKKSIDVAMYLLTSESLAKALTEAHGRGVKVRVLLDGAESKLALSKKTDLLSGGVPVKTIATSGGVFDPKFHHKFAVIDGAETIAGSFNWTEGADLVNYENVVFLHDSKVASAYEKEFESLYSSKKGGTGSAGNVVFAPSGGAHALEKRISDEIAKAKKEIVVAMYEMTSTECLSALEAALGRGVSVSLLIDARNATISKTAISGIKSKGGEVKKVVLGGTGIHAAEFHDKYAVIDGARVLTGSYNWGPHQDADGYEDLIVIEDAALAKSFVANFSAIWTSKVAHAH
ncbi:DUF1669 domain-containing protein [bacterium]|nr:DUF1669 domain-containing protein [bacterium]